MEINGDAGRTAEREVREAGGEAVFLETDVTRDDSVKRAMDATIAKCGQLDVLLNCAGGSLQEDLPVHEMDLDVWHRTITLNLLHPFLCCRHGIPHMIKAGGGSIIDVSSHMGLVGSEKPSYAAAKGGIVAFTRTLAAQYVDHGIRANAIAPGTVRTERSIKRWESKGSPFADKTNPQVRERLARHKLYPFSIGEPMKITKAETIVVKIPMVIEGNAIPHPGGHPRTSVETLLLRVDTDEGISGWGEASANRLLTGTKTTIDSVIGEMCIGRDPTAITDLATHLERSLGASGRSSVARFAISAIDIALWDIAGKLAGLPLYRLLGGSLRRDLPGYASLLRYTDPATIARYTERALQRGFRHIKLHEITLPALRAGRDAAGPDIPIMVDVNCAWTVTEAIRMAHQLEPLDLKWIEEPVWPPEDFAGIARVRNEGGISTAAGENAMFTDFFHMFEAGSLTYAQPSVSRVGGVTQFRKVLALAEAFGVEVVPHSAYFGPGLIASLHCAAAMQKETLVERYDVDFTVNPMRDAIKPDSNGRFTVPQGPGPGVDPDLAVIEKFRVA